MPDFEPLARTEPTNVSGYRTPDALNTSRVVVDMQDRILLYQPDVTPFLTMSGRVKGKRKAINRKFEWLEKDFKPRKLTENGAITDVGTTLNVAAGDGSKVSKNDYLRNTRTGDIMLVSSIATDALTVVRGIGGAGVAGVDADVYVILGSSFPDNSLIGDMRSINEYNNFSYTQIFRTAFGFSGRDLVTELFGDTDKAIETKWQGVEHKKSIEYAAYFGKRHVIAAAGGVAERTFTGGLEWAIQSNVWNVGGVALNSRVFNEFLEEGLRWGKGGRLQGGAALKYLLCSSRWLTEINSWAESRLEYRVLDDEIGFAAMEYKSPHGRVRLLSSPLLDEYHPDYAFLIDFNHADYVYLRQRDTRLLDDRQENDRDGEAYEYMSDCGFQFSFEQSHALLKGISV